MNKTAKLNQAFQKQKGHFGIYGGRYVPETLIPALDELEDAFNQIKFNKNFWKRLNDLFKDYAGRPTPLYYAENLTKKIGGAKIFLKREDLAHTGSHKINNALGQGLLAKEMKKKRVIAETGAGQHGVACATVCSLLGLDCVIYMGAEDIQRQSLNVFRMKLLGAEVISVNSGSKTLKDATSEAFRDWVTNVNSTYYLLGSVVGAHPYPMIVREFQSVIGKEIKTKYNFENFVAVSQVMKNIVKSIKRLPDYMVACVGGGSNAMGMFYPFINDIETKLIGVEAGGLGIESGKHSSSLLGGRPGVLHGSYSYLIQDDFGQVKETHSISAGLDYPGVGPEHSLLKDSGRAQYVSVTDSEAIEGLKILTKTEGIIPALESAHAIYYACKLSSTLSNDKIVIVNVSGRGDKDMHTVANYLGVSL